MINLFLIAFIACGEEEKQDTAPTSEPVEEKAEETSEETPAEEQPAEEE